MRLYKFRRRVFMLFRTHKPMGKSRRPRQKAVIVILVILFILLTFMIFVFSNIKPVLIEIAESDTSDAVTIIMNDAVTAAMKSGKLDYEDLVTLKRDNQGNVTALVANMTKINTFQSDISNSITEQLNKRGYQIVKIPIGNVFGDVLLSGRGPSIPVKIIALTSVTTNFRNVFEEAGINQTQHRIMLDLVVDLDILIPGSTISISVPSELVVAETIIVGDVPSTYTDFTS